jgi:flagellar basal body rod protein FlgG
MDGIGWAVSAMRAARARLENAAQNLANVSSAGFKNTVARIGFTDGGLVVRKTVLHDPAGVNAIGEMVEMLDAQRQFETAQKALGAIDETRAKDVNDVGRVR